MYSCVYGTVCANPLRYLLIHCKARFLSFSWVLFVMTLYFTIASGILLRNKEWLVGPATETCGGRLHLLGLRATDQAKKVTPKEWTLSLTHWLIYWWPESIGIPMYPWAALDPRRLQGTGPNFLADSLSCLRDQSSRRFGCHLQAWTSGGLPKIFDQGQLRYAKGSPLATTF